MVPASPSHVAAQAAQQEPRSSHATARDASRLQALGAVLPPEIAFLASRGAPLGALLSAAAEARRLRVPPDAALVASGAIADDAYVAALARHLGVGYTDAPEEAPVSPVAARAGVAPLPDGRVLVAPEGPAVARLFAFQRAGALPRERVVLTTPRRFAAWARLSAGEAIADEASNELRRADPALSAATGLSRAQVVTLAGLAFLVLAAFGFSADASFALGQALGAVMLAGVLLRLFASAASCDAPPPPSPPLADADLPVYTLIVPLYREAEVAAKLARALDGLDYPRARLDVKIVLEADDRETRAAFERLALPACFEIVVAPPGAPRTKPRALNVALPFARGALVTVYDAEDEPEPGQLRLAAARFAGAPASLACLQARLAIDNSADGWLASLFAIEYAALFDVMNPGLTALNLPMPLGGTSNHFRAIR